jgi:hypothetical protein
LKRETVATSAFGYEAGRRHSRNSPKERCAYALTFAIRGVLAAIASLDSVRRVMAARLDRHPKQ